MSSACTAFKFILIQFFSSSGCTIRQTMPFQINYGIERNYNRHFVLFPHFRASFSINLFNLLFKIDIKEN